MPNRPKFALARQAFREVYDEAGKTVSGVGTLIGGKVDYNINALTPEQGRFENACAIRMSYVLNKTGNKVPFISGQTVSGGAGDWYIYKVKTLILYLKKKFGEPDLTVDTPKAADFHEKKGILVFDVTQWVDASGHATIWDGNTCSDTCYFPIAKRAYLWQLDD